MIIIYIIYIYYIYYIIYIYIERERETEEKQCEDAGQNSFRALLYVPSSFSIFSRESKAVKKPQLPQLLDAKETHQDRPPEEHLQHVPRIVSGAEMAQVLTF